MVVYWKNAGLSALLAIASLAGCKDDADVPGGEAVSPDPAAPKSKKADAEAGEPGASASAAQAEPSSAAKAKASGPKISIAAGTLKAGSRCYDIPRIRPNELEHDAISMGAYEIDRYPYPNEPGKPALLNVTHEQAAKHCEERGQRLCTELEWERACKGPDNSTFMWGNGFKKGRCDGQRDHVTGARAKCETDFGVNDMIGVSLEWTASDWERGTPSGDKVVRGARAEKVSWLSARCTHSRKRNPHQTFDNVGFRCCGGAVNAAKVVLRQRRQTTLAADPAIDSAFVKAMIKAMPRDHRVVPQVELTFDKAYRWHPVANEEMVVARWKGVPQEGPAFYEVVVFKMCGERPWRAAKMTGPVTRLGEPKVGANPRKLSFDVKLGDDSGVVRLSYWHGSVKVTQPPWVKKGNQLASEDKDKEKDKARGRGRFKGRFKGRRKR